MRRILKSSLALLTALTVLVPAFLGGGTASAARWGKNYFPNLPVITHEGKKLRFYDDLIKGKMVVINFIYTNCPDICGLSTARLIELQKRLGDLVGRDIFIYSISLDPKNDTPKALKEYAEAFGVGPGWLFLTGNPKDLRLIRYKLGERSRSLGEHRNGVMLGNDATGEWARDSTMSNLDILAGHIRNLDPKWRARKRKPTKKRLTTARGHTLANRPGEGLFLKACAACHTIGKGVRVGPDLKGVTARRDPDWLIRFLVAPNVMLAKKDPIAMELDAKFPGVRMPNLRLSETDAKDLITYMKTQTKRVSAHAKASKRNKANPQP